MEISFHDFSLDSFFLSQSASEETSVPPQKTIISFLNCLETIFQKQTMSLNRLERNFENDFEQQELEESFVLDFDVLDINDECEILSREEILEIIFMDDELVNIIEFCIKTLLDLIWLKLPESDDMHNASFAIRNIKDICNFLAAYRSCRNITETDLLEYVDTFLLSCITFLEKAHGEYFLRKMLLRLIEEFFNKDFGLELAASHVAKQLNAVSSKLEEQVKPMVISFEPALLYLQVLTQILKSYLRNPKAEMSITLREELISVLNRLLLVTPEFTRCVIDDCLSLI